MTIAAPDGPGGTPIALEPQVVVTLIRSRLPRKQPWRWVAQSAGNHRKLANSGEWYTNRSDALNAIYKLFGAGGFVVLRQEQLGDITLRRPPFAAGGYLYRKTETQP